MNLHGTLHRTLHGPLIALALLPALLLPSAHAASADAGAPPGRSASEAAGRWPLLPAIVAARFDPPESAYGTGHRGVDLLGRPGQPVYAALPGRVSFAGAIAGRGVVVVDHGTTRTTYEPVVSSQPVGTSVSAGGVIGALSVGPSHCAPQMCLHWGWIQQETYLDPLLLVGAGPVRLLPLTATLTRPVPIPGLPPPGLSSTTDWRPLGWWQLQARGCACS